MKLKYGKVFFAFINIIISLVASSLFARDYDWRTDGEPIQEHFDTLDIIGHPLNYQIQQDSKGFIYVANGAGLLIYDGHHWQTISQGQEHSIYSLALGEDGKIYAGPKDDLGYFEADKHGQWHFTSLIEGLEVPRFSMVMKTIKVGEHILFSTDSAFFHFHPEKKLTWHTDFQGPFNIINIPEGQQNVLIPAKNGKIYNYSLDQALLSENTELSHSAPPGIRGIFYREENTVLLYTQTQLFVKKKTGKIDHFKTDIDNWLAKGSITSITENSNGHIVIACRYAGIAIINQRGKLIRHFNKAHGLKSTQLHHIFIDREDNLWISFDESGISRVEIDSNISQFTEGQHSSVSVDIAHLGHVTFASSTNGIYRLKPAIAPAAQAKFKKLNNINESTYYFLEYDNELLVSHNAGVSAFQLARDETLVSKLIYKNTPPFSNYIEGMFSIRNTSQQFYSTSGSGLGRFRKNKQSWQFMGKMKGLQKHIIPGPIENNNLWLGALDGSIYRIKNLDRWPEPNIYKIPIPKEKPQVRAMIFKFNGNIYASNSYSGEIYIYDKKENAFVVSHDIDWDTHNVSFIENVAHTKNGDLWFSTNKNNKGIQRIGLIQAKNENKPSINFSLLDHLEAEFVTNIYTDKNDNLWISGKNRILKVNPGFGLREETFGPPVLSKVSSLGENRTLFTNSHFEDKSLSINLPSDSNAINLQFSAVSYQHAKALEYRYRTTNKNRWSIWSKEVNIELINLPASRTMVEVQYRTNHNNISSITKVRLFRHPYLHEKLWLQVLFWLSLAVFFILCSIFYSRYRLRLLQKQARLLEKNVAERTNEIKIQNEKLLQMDEAKSRFFTNLSHEFRTPLTLVIGPLRDLLANKKTDKNIRDNYLATSLKNALCMESLLGQVLDINRLESDALPINLEKIDLVKNLEYCIQRFSAQADKQLLTIKYLEFPSSLEIFFDPDHFEKIFQNLLSNAIKFSPPNSTISLALEKLADKQISLSIQDQGPGIDKRDREYIFDRYYQGKPSSYTLQPGTGIGLALAKELVLLHQGQISHESPREGGSCFRVTLHLGEDHIQLMQLDSGLPIKVSSKLAISSESLSDNAQITNSDQTHMEKMKVEDNSTRISTQEIQVKTLLIVDDNEELRMFIRAQLQLNYQIIEAENGLSALEVVVSSQPDLIISDVMMPEMDGLEFTRRLKSSIETAHIPIILLSAKNRKWETVAGLNCGADDYLGKPFDSAELLARITSLLNQKQRLAQVLYLEFQKRDKTETKREVLDSGDNSKFSQQILAILDKNLHQSNFDIGTLAERLKLHPAALIRRVRKHFNCTPSQLLRQRRLNISLNLLRENKGSISEVAYACGFESLAYFSRCFSQEFSLPPSRYKEIQ